MPQTDYLAATEYALFGLPISTTDNQITAASNIVDAYLQRTEGLLYTADANGNPLYMTRKAPESSRTLVGGIAPGAQVPVVLTGGPVVTVGDPVVINRAGITAEVCKVETVQDNNHVTLLSVANNHNAGETVEGGMCIEETLTLPKNRSLATVSKGPIASVISVLGRISYTRRGDSMLQMQEYAMLQAASAFGGAPAWQDVQITANDIDKHTNQIWCPVGILMVPYSEIRVSYLAGFSVAGLPYQVKQAVANVVVAIAESPASPNIKSYKAGDSQMTRFLDNVIAADTQKLLAPYMARNYG